MPGDEENTAAPAAAPETPETPETPDTPPEGGAPAKPKSVSEMFRDRMTAKAEARQKRVTAKAPKTSQAPANGAAKPANGAAPAPGGPAVAAKTPETPPAGHQPATDPPKDEPEAGKLALAHARALRGLEQRDAEIAQLRRTSAADAKDAQTWRGLRERAAKPENLVDAIEDLIGQPLANVIQGLYEGKIPPPRSRRYDLPPELREWKDSTDAELAKLREREQESQARESFELLSGQTKAWITNNAEKLPFLAAVEWAATNIAGQAQRGNVDDATDIAISLHNTIRDTTVAILSDKRARKALLSSNEKLRKELAAELAELGAAPAKSNDSGPRAGNGPSSNGHTNGALGASSSEGVLPDLADLDQDQRAQLAHEEFAKRMAAKRKQRTA